jgi:cellulose synthase/poly-beta-1,6-N-acetylglucosamine synthase-like glycosyltransferase
MGEAVLMALFWLSFVGLLHTYVLYPLLLWILAKGRKSHTICYHENEDWPAVAVLMSAYNEEAVIEEKMERLLALQYPAGTLELFIGSDCSDDRTDAILEQYAAEHSHLHFFPFRKRQGKPGVINQLAAAAAASQKAGPNQIFVVTDASVMPEPEAVKHLAKHFKDPRIGLVDGHIRHVGMKREGISQAENSYISTEAQLKYWEGLLWGGMMGPFGGLYALRAEFFSPVPDNFLVDDFYICMRVFEQGGLAISDLDAVSYETVSHEAGEEFRRKSRISAGNFQNLSTFTQLWWPPFGSLRFAFFSHKALRWLGPFLLLALLLGSGALALLGNIFYERLFFLLSSGMLAAFLLDVLFRRLGIHFLPLRGARYFLLMNVALLTGFFKFLKGIRSNVWQPTKRV